MNTANTAGGEHTGPAASGSSRTRPMRNGRHADSARRRQRVNTALERSMRCPEFLGLEIH